MQKFNYHTHTYRCGHAQKGITDEELVKGFIEKGFTTIAFTDHSPQKEVIDTRDNMRMPYSQKEEYLNSIKNLKEKYKDIVKIETGFEVEYLPRQEENIYELKNEVDKIILGQHFVFDDDNKLKIFRHADFKNEDLIKYAEYIKTAIEKGIPDIIAHPDLYMLTRDKFGKTEQEVSKIICSTAEKYNVPLEINLSDANLYIIGRKNKINYPCKEFWEIASQYNIRVLYGVDAHYKSQIQNYEKSIEIVNDIIGKDIINKLNFCEEF